MHLGRYLAAHVTQRLVPAGIDPLGVSGGAMIHPDDHVALGASVGPTDKGARRDRARPGAGRVEAHAGESPRGSSDALTASRTADGRRAPDVFRGMLDDLARFAPDRDRPPGAGDTAALR